MNFKKLTYIIMSGLFCCALIWFLFKEEKAVVRDSGPFKQIKSSIRKSKAKLLPRRQVPSRTPAQQSSQQNIITNLRRERELKQKSRLNKLSLLGADANFGSAAQQPRRPAAIAKDLRAIEKSDYQVSMGDIVSQDSGFYFVKVDPDNLDPTVMKEVVVNPTTRQVRVRTGRISLKLARGVPLDTVISGFPVSVFYEAPDIDRYILNVDNSDNLNNVINQLKQDPNIVSIGAELFAEKPGKN